MQLTAEPKENLGKSSAGWRVIGLVFARVGQFSVRSGVDRIDCKLTEGYGLLEETFKIGCPPLGVVGTSGASSTVDTKPTSLVLVS